MAVNVQREPRALDRDSVIEKCRRFSDFQLWPMTSDVDPERWLSNFTDSESEHALHLLNSFMFYSRKMTEQMFVSAIHNISTIFSSGNGDFRSCCASWEGFFDGVIVTYVTGETPNPTDSGFAYARLTRQAAAIPEDRIVMPQEALSILAANSKTPILFVDDFVGSGQQFIRTYNRKYDISGIGRVSFEDVIQNGSNSLIVYCPAICTQLGRRRIRESAKEVVISAGTFLPPQSSALHPRSILWPDHLKPTAKSFVKAASMRAGIPSDCWQGFWRLGLALAFADSTPDATLPIFYWEENGWKPLVRRS